MSAQQITLQPSPAAITAPEGYVFTLQAAGANNLSVRWYLNGAPAPGALSTENTYTATLSPSTAGNYTFRVIGGQSTVESDPIPVLIGGSASAGSNLPSQATVLEGRPFSLQAALPGGSATYQWYKNDSPIPSADSYLLRLLNVQQSQAGTYFCRITNGQTSIDTPPSTITVAPTTPTVRLTGASRYPVAVWPAIPTEMSGVLLLATADGTGPLQFSWAQNGSPLAQAHGPWLETGVTVASAAAPITVTASNTQGESSASSDLKFGNPIAVAPSAPIDRRLPSSRVVRPGERVVMEADVYGSVPLQYQWYKGDTSIPGATNRSYVLPSVGSDDASSYRIEVVNSVGTTRFPARRLILSADNSWENFTALTQHDLNAVAVGAGIFVAVGNHGAILTSANGSDWSRPTSPTSADLRSVVHGAGRFVAVGDGGTVLTSANGSEWTVQPAMTAENINAAAYADGRFVIAGARGFVATAADGLNWTPSDTGQSTIDYTYATAGESKWLVGNSAFYATTTDGQHWNPRENPIRNHDIASVRWVSDHFELFVGIDHARSLDGIAWWTEDVSVPNGHVSDIVSFQGVKIFVGQEGLQYTEASHLVNTDSSPPGRWLAVATSADLAVAVGRSGQIAISADGKHWTMALSSLGNRKLGAVKTAANGTLVALSEYGDLFVSPNGANWIPTSLPAKPNSDRAFSSVDGKLFVRTVDNRIFSTTDASVWTALPGTGLQLPMAAGPGRYISLEGQPAYSDDGGLTWRAGTFSNSNAPTSGCIGAVYGNNCYVAGFGLNGGIARSSDGATWTVTQPAISVRSVAFGNGLFIALADSDEGLILTSPDGSTWHWADLEVGTLNKIRFLNGKFYAAGAGDVLLSSSDGTTWTGENVDGRGWLDIAATGQSYVLVGDNGATLVKNVVHTPPLIVHQSASRNVIAPGDSLTLSVSSAGTGGTRTYQWTRNGLPIPGATTDQLTLANATALDSGYYLASITDRDGTTVSSPIFVNVAPLAAQLHAWGSATSGATTVPPGVNDATSVAAAGSHAVALRQDGTVIAWGSNVHGESTVPGDLSGIVAVAAGQSHTLALRQDGVVVAWGDNSHSQCAVPAGLKPVVAVAAGGDQSLALQSDGTIATWGLTYPNQIAALAGVTDVIAIAAGSDHALALRANGSIIAWGDTTTDSALRTLTPPPASPAVKALAASGHHSIFLRADGTIATTGDTASGQGNVPSISAPIIAVAAGNGHNLALDSTGRLVAWGSNAAHESNVPTWLSETWAAAAGDQFSIALRVATNDSPPAISSSPTRQYAANGGTVTFTVIASGSGELTYRWERRDSTIADSVETLSDNATYSGTSTNALTITGVSSATEKYRFSCYVSNRVGTQQSGSGDVRIITAPTVTLASSLSAALGGNAQLSASVGSLAPTTFQWKRDGVEIPGATQPTLNLVGLTSADSGAYTLTATNPAGSVTSAPLNFTAAPAYGVTSASAGSAHSVFVRYDHTLWGMGSNNYNVLSPSFVSSLYPWPVRLATEVLQAAAGDGYTAIVGTDHSLGWIGRGFPTDTGSGSTSVYLQRHAIDTGVEFVSAASTHLVYLKTDGTAWAFGRNDRGQLGTGNTSTPSNPVSLASGVRSVLAAGKSTFIVKLDGTLWACGDNQSGQLGTGDTVGAVSLRQIATNVTAVAAGDLHTVFLKADGSLWGMGHNFSGELGPNVPRTVIQNYVAGPPQATPVQLASNVTQIAAGPYITLYRLADGTTWATGRNADSQLGDGTSTTPATPVSVTGGNLSVSSIGTAQTLMVRANGELWSNGLNLNAELGDGTTDRRNSPVRIAGGPLALVDVPSISSSPQSVIVAPGQSATFSVSATSAATLTYQWRRNQVPLSGAQSATLTLSQVGTGDAGAYDVVVGNGANSVTSAAATLKLAQTLTFAPPVDLHFTLDPVSLSASSDSGLPVTLALTSGPASWDGSQLHLTGIGTVTIQATQNGNEIWAAAAPITRSFASLSSFASWQLATFGTNDAAVAGPNIAPARDGLTNLLRYALGLPAGTAALPALPTVSKTETEWVYRFTKPVSVTDVTVVVEVSTDMVHWTPRDAQVSSDGTTETWTVTCPTTQPCAFFRVRVDAAW
ncbi:MAG: immunoglobulin domain-containing protein [Candidatus Didemnitutus sp.]|nr:immunoglobulin domain-containing protein [Candidatus Didemnitutus sp.]